MKKHTRKKSKHRQKQKSFDDFVRDTIVEIRHKCHFEDYEIFFKIAKSDKSDEDSGDGVAASINVDTRYLNAHITIYPALVRYYKNKDTDFIRAVLCHELAHIRTQKLFNYTMDRFIKETDVRDTWEGLTEQYGRLLLEKINRK